MREHITEIEAKGKRIALVVARFNEFICRGLLEGALEALEEMGVEEIDVFWVPGAFEIPLAAKRVALTGQFDGIVALGAVIRGETAHFEYVAGEAARGISQVSLETGIPIGFGVLATQNTEQAVARASCDQNNKGREAAEAVVEMVCFNECAVLPRR